MYKATFDRVTEYFTGERFMPEVKRAKDEYFQRTGKVFEDEPAYESRMVGFLEWYLFDRELRDYGVAPIRLFSESFGDGEGKERATLRALERTVHSLFEFQSHGSKTVKVRDLFNDEIHEVSERRSYSAFRRGDLLDARLITVANETLFSDAMWVHPTEVKPIILSAAKECRDRYRDRLSDLLLDLSYMKLKSERYKHLPAATIYKFPLVREGALEGKEGSPN